MTIGVCEINHLLTGIETFSRFEGKPAQLEAAWQTHRDTLLPRWIATHPGTRPWAWWHYEAPERRRRVDGKPHPFDSRERQAKAAAWRAEHPDIADGEATRIEYGKPNCLMTFDDFDARYESELEYLNRLDLLTEAERETLCPLGA